MEWENFKIKTLKKKIKTNPACPTDRKSERALKKLSECLSKTVGSKRKDLIGAQSVVNLNLLRMLPCPQK